MKAARVEGFRGCVTCPPTCCRAPCAATRCTGRATILSCRCSKATTSPRRPAPASSTPRRATAARTSTSGPRTRGAGSRRHRSAIPFTVDADGAFTADAPGFEGKRVITDKGEKGDANEAVIQALVGGRQPDRARPAQAPVSPFLALQEAGDLPQHAAVVHHHGRRQAGRAARPGAEGHRRGPVGAARRAQPHAGHDRAAPRLGDLAPARLGGADNSLQASGVGGRSPSADFAASEELIGASPRPSKPRAPMPGSRTAPRSGFWTGWWTTRRRGTRSTTFSTCGSNRAPPMPSCSRCATTSRSPQARRRQRPRHVSRGLRPAPRLVPFLAARILRHARPRALRRGADPWLRGRRGRAQDVEVARQHRRAPGRHPPVGRRDPAAVGGLVGLRRGPAPRP
jgi:hypothetical protein